MGLPLVFLDLVALRASSLSAELSSSALASADVGVSARSLEVMSRIVGA